jgi:hypothetical protein
MLCGTAVARVLWLGAGSWLGGGREKREEEKLKVLLSFVLSSQLISGQWQVD